MKTCCYNCPDRTLTCHTDCELYAMYQKDVQARNDNRRKEKACGSVINSNLRYDLWVKHGHGRCCNTREKE